MFVQRLVIIVLVIVSLVAVLNIWKYEGKGAAEWHTEYDQVLKEDLRIRKCLLEFDQEPAYRREEGVYRYCRL